MRYNWQQPDWPNFRYDLSFIQDKLLAIAEKSGLISGKLSHLNNQQQTEALLDLLVEEAIKTSEIEGEYISRPDVRSSIQNKLGLYQEIKRTQDQRAVGIAELVLDVRNTFKESLSETKLFDWHLMLLASSSNPNLRVGAWRIHEEPMQIVSGHHGKWVTHFEAPPSAQVPKEMHQFINWFNETEPGGVHAIPFAPVRSAIAHLYFESIHPFEDGNGRIGRAIAEKALSQGVGHPVMLSLSHAIQEDKKAYYSALNKASQSNDITDWIIYFVTTIQEAQKNVEEQINFIIKKARFFDSYEHQLNDRELKVIKRMLQTGVEGFAGGMSAKKYMAITQTSKATATRDLQHLLTMQVFKQIGAGRSVRYELNI